MSDQLLPCPFCGSEGIRREYTGKHPYKYLIGCMNCCCQVGGHRTEKEAIENWNTRHPAKRSVEEISGELNKFDDAVFKCVADCNHHNCRRGLWTLNMAIATAISKFIYGEEGK